MKKINILIIALISIFAFNINVYAASGSLSTNTGSVYVGDSFTVYANINGAAAWNVHVSASGPVSGCSINQADATSDALDTNKSFSATCTATATGTITVTLSGDVTSAIDGNAVYISGTKNITVSNRPSQPSNNPSTNNNTNNTPKEEDNRSKNNNIKDISVENYSLTKIDNNNYTLTVPNDVTSINIKATPEDSKSKITGTGNHNINVGENNIEIIVTAENGTENKINIKVTRKDGYDLEDLDSVLKSNSDKNINIKSDTKISSSDLEKIKNSRKTVKFNNYNSDNKLIYSWIIDGSKLKNTSDLETSISNDSNNKKDILRLSNYADGLFASLKQTSNLPSGTKIKLFVGNKYEDNDLVNAYAYVKNNDKLKLVNKNIKVNDGYVEFDIVESSDYFITMSNISNSNNVITQTEKTSSTLPIIIIIGGLSLLVIVLTIALILKKKKNKEEDSEVENSIQDTNKPVFVEYNTTNQTSPVNNNINGNHYDNTIL